MAGDRKKSTKRKPDGRRHQVDDETGLRVIPSTLDAQLAEFPPTKRLGAYMLADGRQHVEIAEACDVSARTVRRWSAEDGVIRAVNAIRTFEYARVEALRTSLARHQFDHLREASDFAAKLVAIGQAAVASQAPAEDEDPKAWKAVRTADIRLGVTGTKLLTALAPTILGTGGYPKVSRLQVETPPPDDTESLTPEELDERIAATEKELRLELVMG